MRRAGGAQQEGGQHLARHVAAGAGTGPVAELDVPAADDGDRPASAAAAAKPG